MRKAAAQGSRCGSAVLLREVQDNVVECESTQGSKVDTALLCGLRDCLHGRQKFQILLPSVLLCLNAQVATRDPSGVKPLFLMLLFDKYTAR